MLAITDVHYKGILHHVSAQWQSGLIGIIGPNGAGKSTLLKLIAGIERPDSGSVCLKQTPVSQLSARQRAQEIAYLPQQIPDEVIFTVREFVEMGRYAHRRSFGGLSSDCRGAVDAAIERMNVESLENHVVGQLSGGERQRVAIARCLAQGSRILVLDEPISNLDLYYQINILTLLSELAREGYLIILAIHHLELAAQYCNELMMLHEGKVFRSGSVDYVMQREAVSAVFQMDVQLFHDPFDQSIRLSYSTAGR